MVVCFQVSSNVETRRFADLTPFPVARTCCVSMRVDRVRALRRKRGKSWFWYSRHRNWNTMFSWVMLVTSPVKKASAHAHSWTRKEYLLFWLSEVSFTRCNFCKKQVVMKMFHCLQQNFYLTSSKLRQFFFFFLQVCVRFKRWEVIAEIENLRIKIFQ